MSVPVHGNIKALMVVDFGKDKTWSAVNDTTAEQDVDVRGLEVGDVILGIQKPTHQTGLAVPTARVKSAGVLAVTFITTANVTPTAKETYKVLVARLERIREDAVA